MQIRDNHAALGVLTAEHLHSITRYTVSEWTTGFFPRGLFLGQALSSLLPSSTRRLLPNFMLISLLLAIQNKTKECFA